MQYNWISYSAWFHGSMIWKLALVASTIKFILISLALVVRSTNPTIASSVDMVRGDRMLGM
jgi:hypothetical protein